MSEPSTSTTAGPPPPQLHLSLPAVPTRLYTLPLAGLVLGSLLGLTRGARLASLRFLAENAHRPPTTVRGWYFYNKTKNYRVLMGGLGEAGREGAKVGVVAAVWAAVEVAAERVGGWVGEAREVGAGVGSAGVFSVLCEYCFCAWCVPCREQSVGWATANGVGKRWSASYVLFP